MLNYEIDPDVLLPRVPAGTELDSWQGKTFVSMVGFLFLYTRVMGLSIPRHRNFAEINLRFYVRREAPDGWRRGVVFVKEIVPRRAIAAVARWVYNENYVTHPMHSSVLLPHIAADGVGAVEYGWRSSFGNHALRARFTGGPHLPAAASEAAFITEHYWGYVARRRASLEYRVEHPPWRVWPACDAELTGDSAGFYGAAYAEALTRPPTSAFVAEGSPVIVRQGEKIRRDC